MPVGARPKRGRELHVEAQLVVPFQHRVPEALRKQLDGLQSAHVAARLRERQLQRARHQTQGGVGGARLRGAGRPRRVEGDRERHALHVELPQGCPLLHQKGVGEAKLQPIRGVEVQ